MTETYNNQKGLVADWISNIREEVFPRIKEERDAHTLGDFLNTQEIIKEVINEMLDCYGRDEVEDIIREYGIHSSLCIYINRFGAESMEHISQDGDRYALSSGLLCAVTLFIMEDSYEEYKVWCKNSVRVMTCASCNLDYPEDEECRQCGYFA